MKQNDKAKYFHYNIKRGKWNTLLKPSERWIARSIAIHAHCFSDIEKAKAYYFV
jgi:hypothetical protein